MLRRRSSTRPRGFTLPELLTVVAITGVLGAVAMFSLSGYGNGQDAAGLARSIQFALMRARAEALAENYPHTLSCTVLGTSQSCTLSTAADMGLSNAPSLDVIQAGTHAYLWNITSSCDQTTNNAGATQMSGNKVITFNSDGTITNPSGTRSGGTTFYVSDKNGANKYKVYVFGGTGLARVVNNW
jgi:prepilin-type N-terminal cleavage/methylation domain-containing protein